MTIAPNDIALVLGLLGIFCFLFVLGAPASVAEERAKPPPVSTTTTKPNFGIASWYGEEYRGKPMANGAPFDPDERVCASWDYPLGTVLCVRLVGPLRGGSREVWVAVTDRGPSRELYARGRILDLSQKAFATLAPLSAGLIEVEIAEVVLPTFKIAEGGPVDG